jgi:hypothetical protein
MRIRSPPPALACSAHAQKFSDWSPPVSPGAIVNSAGDDAGSSISSISTYRAARTKRGYAAIETA